MNEISSKQYSKDEVDRIIRRALKLTKNDSINHQELIDTAKEFGIDPQTLETAIEEDKEEFEKERSRKTRLLRCKARFHHHLWSYLIVIGALLQISSADSVIMWIAALTVLIRPISERPNRFRIGSRSDLGGSFMIPLSWGSNPNTMSDGPSQIRWIHKICATSSGAGQPSSIAPKINSTSANEFESV